eukprot:366508-Chlamydomonas_euryale.AAC.3
MPAEGPTMPGGVCPCPGAWPTWPGAWPTMRDLTWLPRMVKPLDALFKHEEKAWEADDAEAPAAAGSGVTSVTSGGSGASKTKQPSAQQ